MVLTFWEKFQYFFFWGLILSLFVFSFFVIWLLGSHDSRSVVKSDLEYVTPSFNSSHFLCERIREVYQNLTFMRLQFEQMNITVNGTRC